MPTGRQGSIHLFRFSGIDVFLHWSWFLVALLEIQRRSTGYSSITWNILEYLALFVIVMLHEFGHALACRQVGGRANRIVLWPLGGVAYVDPPPRPGATLWSIAAGPLVNIALLPILVPLYYWLGSFAAASTVPDLARLVHAILWIDIWLFVFNILPIYPLDGGQILRALLWFPLGRGRSLQIATILGFVGVVGVVGVFALALFFGKVWPGEMEFWLGAIAVFMLLNCWGGLRHAQALLKLSKLPRRQGFSCPSCKTPPPAGAYWKCGNCGQPFDTFQTGAVCPNCRTQFPATQCLDCGRQHALGEWAAAAPISSSLVMDSELRSPLLGPHE
jgi:Zn-dependent protease